MKKKLRYIILLMLAVSIIFSCKKDEIALEDYSRPVVQGYLIPGNKIEVKVYYQKYLDDTIAHGFPIKGLELQVSDGTNSVSLTETSDGVYTYSDTTFVKDAGTYSLSFNYLGKQIKAETIMPQKPVSFSSSAISQKVPVFSFGTEQEDFVPVIFRWLNTDGGYYMMVMANIDEYPSRINTRDPRGYSNVVTILGQVSTYQTQQMTFRYAGNYKIKLFRINKEYVDAMNSSGGTSLNLTNPSTNIQNGLGIFTAMQGEVLDLLVYQ
ncbi:MAG: DUF4249 family protein [Pedobacter sp.]|nr:MAG: DUF4249 family protein [Pedobacter sp.]